MAPRTGPGILLECDGGWLLLDTGFNTALIRDPALRRRFHGDSFRPILPGPGEPLAEALAQARIDLSDVSAVAVSHLHLDHAGGLKLFAGRVPVHVQRTELAYGLSGHPEPERNGIYRIDFDDPRIDWRQEEAVGEAALEPGTPLPATSRPATSSPHGQARTQRTADRGPARQTSSAVRAARFRRKWTTHVIHF